MRLSFSASPTNAGARRPFQPADIVVADLNVAVAGTDFALRCYIGNANKEYCNGNGRNRQHQDDTFDRG